MATGSPSRSGGGRLGVLAALGSALPGIPSLILIYQALAQGADLSAFPYVLAAFGLPISVGPIVAWMFRHVDLEISRETANNIAMLAAALAALASGFMVFALLFTLPFAMINDAPGALDSLRWLGDALCIAVLTAIIDATILVSLVQDRR